MLAKTYAPAALEDNREKLKAEMERYRLTEYDMARQLGLSIYVVKSYLSGGSAPHYVEKLVAEWLE